MSSPACPPCGLRFRPSTWSLCPQCEGPVVTLESAEQAVGMQLFTAPAISLPALAAALAARPETQPPPHD